MTHGGGTGKFVDHLEDVNGQISEAEWNGQHGLQKRVCEGESTYGISAVKLLCTLIDCQLWKNPPLLSTTRSTHWCQQTDSEFMQTTSWGLMHGDRSCALYQLY